MNPVQAKVSKSFSEHFSSSPALFFSPGRINLIGEHIDYNDGFVMPAAINKGIYYAVSPTDTETINIYSLDFNEKLSISRHEIEKKEGWKNYVLGVVNELILAGKPVGGFDCVFAGDIPRGSGMSSSAAVEGGLAFALDNIFSFALTRLERALLSQRAEHNFPGVKCGIMDMYASLNGKKDHVLLLDCQKITHEYLPLRPDGYKIVLFNSKVHHSLAGGEYNNRRKSCGEGLEILKKYLPVNSFRDLTPDQVDLHKDKMPAEVYACCKYVVEEIERTKKAAVLLRRHEITAFGKLMFETHEGLSHLYKVSCPELDFLVAKAAAHPEIVGSRLMGGGFGGCTINIVKEEQLSAVIADISQAYREAFNIDTEVYIVETADGTTLINS